MRQLEYLYHLAEADNVTSILKHGLLSTERLLALVGMEQADQAVFIRRHREQHTRLGVGVSIRDQRPMPPSALAKALEDGLEPGDWYTLLNGFVFLWPDRDRLERQRRACGGRPQRVLTFDAAALFTDFGSSAFLSPINSGNARRKPSRRGRRTFVPYQTWIRDGWGTRPRSHPPAEVLFRCAIPARSPYLATID